MSTILWESKTEIEYVVYRKSPRPAALVVFIDTDGIFRAPFAAYYAQEAAERRKLPVRALARSLYPSPPGAALAETEAFLRQTFPGVFPQRDTCRQISEADTCASLLVGATGVHTRALIQMFPLHATRITGFAAFGGDVFLPEKPEPQAYRRCAELLRERTDAVLDRIGKELLPPHDR